MTSSVPPPGPALHLRAPLPLRCPVQPYAWGRPSSSSVIATVLGLPPTEDPCAELWMGAHPSAPAEVVAQGFPPIALDRLIREHPAELLGEDCTRQFGARLPFLFKLLTIARALSIQAHPDRVLAEQLHREQPDHYSDPNHKPEMAIALGHVELLYGFRPMEAIQSAVADLLPLRLVIGESVVSRVLDRGKHDESETLRGLYAALVNASPSRISEATEALRSSSVPHRWRAEMDWIEKLIVEYPDGDIGLFSFFLLQLVTLDPGDAVFIGPNIPHAYLGGDLIECMANSDNVVRCGLTRKFCDAHTLIRMLAFDSRDPVRVVPTEIAPGVEVFQPPAAEFGVVRIRRSTEGEIPVRGPAILIVLRGSCAVGWFEGSGESSQGGAGSGKRRRLQIGAGQVIFLPYCLGTLGFSGDEGEFYIAGIPDFCGNW